MQYNDVPGSDEEMELGAVGSDVSVASEGIPVLYHFHFQCLTFHSRGSSGGVSTLHCCELLLSRAAVWGGCR